jgi:hypothetical protein
MKTSRELWIEDKIVIPTDKGGNGQFVFVHRSHQMIGNGRGECA